MTKPPPLNLDVIRRFIRLDSLVGLLLISSTLLALFLANSPFQDGYEDFIATPLKIGFKEWSLSKPVLLWINDGLMALFFLQIGLELKREMVEGQLSKLSQILLPGVAAVGGVCVPALIYIVFNFHDPLALKGWAIPSATDIAFALGILSMLGSRVPSSLKLFLLSVAIYDDLAAIIIIAICYTSELSVVALGLSCVVIGCLILCNKFNVIRLSIYGLLGTVLWCLVLKSGVHATLAGVILAFTIPIKIKGHQHSPLKTLEHGLYGWVSFLIIPLFAFSNAGVNFQDITLNDLTSPLTLGIALGLFFGKQIGIFLFTFLLIKCKFAELPEKASWKQLYGVAALGGIGFTMSLFISTLAFENEWHYIVNSRLGILLGTALSAIAGIWILRSTK
jgi:NhaA family Na+:H+ antiporter